MRILVLIAIGLLLYVILNNLFRKNRVAPSKMIKDTMVRCEHCDLHLLEDEAIQYGEAYYCSQAHRDLEK